MKKFLQVAELAMSKKTLPTGNPNFAVLQAFPAGISDTDPFLMCDHFGPVKSKGLITNPDEFSVPWHPHRGMDILTYLLEGVGRHADSLGNRGEYASPGMQWISVGSGIEHAEGGGTPLGMNEQGFQIWVNVPSQYKMDDPVYGTEPPEKIPIIRGDDTSILIQPSETGTADFPYLRLLAGEYGSYKGPFQTKQDVQIVDYTLPSGSQRIEHHIHPLHDNALLYVYRGSGTVSGTPIKQGQIARFDLTNPTSEERVFEVIADGDNNNNNNQGISFIFFAGQRIREPVAWRGPFVMNTQEEIQKTMREYQQGRFPPKRVSWDYTKIATKPEEKKQEEL
jgi:quercetin 2,3-dioxygenase